MEEVEYAELLAVSLMGFTVWRVSCVACLVLSSSGGREWACV